MIKRKGFEADDLIGSISKRADQEGLLTYLYSIDGDFKQLLTGNVMMINHNIKENNGFGKDL